MFLRLNRFVSKEVPLAWKNDSVINHPSQDESNDTKLGIGLSGFSIASINFLIKQVEV